MESIRAFVPPYDRDYARKYNAAWLENDLFKVEVQHHVETLRTLIRPRMTWLDCGCGTGYFLSHFKGVDRAGFDLSETMLEVARESNPDAQFFERHDIRLPKPEWNGRWDLVSCTGQPWCYLDRIDEVAQVVKNLYDWTARGGTCFITPQDVQDVFGIRVGYDFAIEQAANHMNAVIWTCVESGDNIKHTCMIYPNFDQWIRWFTLYFSELEIGKWPAKSCHIERRYLLCRKKKETPNAEPPTIVGVENAQSYG
jgi:SAM-dependent methyltransferase